MMKLAEGKGQFIRNGSPPDDYRQYLLDKGYDADLWKTWENPEYDEKGCVTFPLPEEDYIDVWTGTEGVKHLEQVEGPFFSWVSFSGPHTPWDPPAPYDTMYDPDQIPMPSRRRGALEEKNPLWVDTIARTIPACPAGSINRDREGGIENAYNRFPDSQVRRMLAAYYGQITLIDKQIGRLIEVLEKCGVLDNTLIIFTADHGDYLGNNWAFFKHAAAYDSLARVPMLMRWPEAIAQGKTRDQLVSLVDLAPTILEAAGLAPEEEMDGVALQPLFKDEPAQWRDDLYMEAGLVNTLFTDDWKYLRYSQSGVEELYNRKSDPHDLHNVASKPDNAGRCEAMAERLAALLKR